MVENLGRASADRVRLRLSRFLRGRAQAGEQEKRELVTASAADPLAGTVEHRRMSPYYWTLRRQGNRENKLEARGVEPLS